METIRKSSVRDVTSPPLVVVRDYDTIWHASDRFVQMGLHHLVVLDPGDVLARVQDRGVLAGWPLDLGGTTARSSSCGQLAAPRKPVCPETHTPQSVSAGGLLMLVLGVDARAVVDDFRKVVAS